MGSIKLPHASGNSMSIAAPATNPASDLELKLPATIGTAGQVLKNSSTAGTLEFGGGGKILQVVQGTTTTEIDISSTTYTDTNLSATINNVASGSKILVCISQHCKQVKNAFHHFWGMRLLRGSTEIFTDYNDANTGGTAIGYNLYNLSATTFVMSHRYNVQFLDSSPGTGTVTYKTQASTGDTADSAYIRLNDNPSAGGTADNGDGFLTLFEVAA